MVKRIVAATLQSAGLGVATVAGFVVHPVAGLVTLAVALLVAGVAVERQP